MKRVIFIVELLLLMSLAACTASHQQNVSTTRTPAGLHPSADATPLPTGIDKTSVLGFTASGGINGTFLLHTSSTISMLRHGHKEFTIDVVDGPQTVFLVFYGYTGVGSYQLSNPLNGGEVHISFGTTRQTWDLTATPGASCALTITRDQPTRYAGIDSMQGTFACPRLAPVISNQHIAPLSVTRGYFTILILVQS